MEQELSRVIRLSHLGPELVVPPQSLLRVLDVQLQEFGGRKYSDHWRHQC